MADGKWKMANGKRERMEELHMAKREEGPIRGAGRAVPTPVLALIFSGGALGGLALLMFTAPGCASLPVEPRQHAGSAEALGRGTPIVVTVTPPPWNSLAEAALGLISAGLATWNVQQHRRLAALEAANPSGPEKQDSEPRKTRKLEQ
jgi:hypothetical protein